MPQGRAAVKALPRHAIAMRPRGCLRMNSCGTFQWRADKLPGAAGKLTPPPMSQTKPALAPERAQLLLRRCLELWRQNLLKNEQARAYLASLGITDLALLERVGCGYSSGELIRTLPPDDVLKADLSTLGVLTKRKGRERFEGQLVFPVLGANGQIASVWGLDREHQVTPLNREPSPPWNIIAAKNAGVVLVAPTLLDALALMTAGEPHVVAMPPSLVASEAELFRTWGVQRFRVVHGNTPESAAEAERICALLGIYSKSTVALPGAGALAMLGSRGAAALAEALVKAEHGVSDLQIHGMLPLTDGFSLLIANRRYEVRGLQASPGKMKATIRLERGGKQHIDMVELFSARARRQLVIDLIRLTEESADAIEADVAKLLAACELRAAQPEMQSPTEASPLAEADRREAEAMGKDARLIDLILEDFERYGLVGEGHNKLLCYVAMTSRKMERPVSVLSVSGSGTGKSALQEALCAFCPPEDLIKISNLSPKALFHRQKDSLRHKFLALEETVGAEAASYALRVLISAGELVTEVATKDPASGRLVSTRSHVAGPVSVSLTTTSPNTDPETKSRFFVLSTDESSGQTDAILELQRRQATLAGLELPKVRKEICRRHHAFQRLLQPVRVVNPLVDRLGRMTNRLTARRDQPKLLGLVAAIAFLRQMQKPVKQYQNTHYIEVDEQDLRILAGMVRELFSPANAEISRPARDLLALLDAMRKDAGKAGKGAVDFTFSRREVREFAKWERTRVHRYLNELVNLEFVIRDRSRRGATERYTLEWDGDVTFGAQETLLPFEDLAGGGKGAA